MASRDFYISSFKRVEKKYLLTKEQYQSFLKETKDYITLDQYGLHTICNIYYDTAQDDLIRYSISKPKYKEKLRLRSYGIPNEDSTVFLELKKKYNGIVYKRRTTMTLAQARKYLDEGEKPEEDSQILREIDYFLKYYKPKGKLFLAYDRMAFFGTENNELRLTIDQNIRSRTTDLDLSHGDSGTYLLEGEQYLMEIKVPGVFPIWLSRILSKLEIYPVSFSKYGNIYKKSLREERGL